MLSNLTVLELGSVLAVPAVGSFFAELGAKVIKIENKTTQGDVTRSWRLSADKDQNLVSAYYASVNWGKETHFLDLSQPEAQEFVHQLAAKSQIVLANFNPKSARKLHIDYETLKKYNPQLIYANLTGFGEESNRLAFDAVLQAEAGFMYMNGQQDSLPTKMPVAFIDLFAAHQLKEGILLALLLQKDNPKSYYVSVSLLEAALASLANQASNYLMADYIPQRLGSLHPNIAPYGEIFCTADGIHIILAVGNDKQFNLLCQGLNQPLLLENPLFQNNILRVKHRADLAQILQIAFAQQQSADILAFCHENGVPVGQVRNLAQVFQLPEAQKLVLSQTEADGKLSKRVKTAIFNLK